jgi:hypothetical protein
MFSNRFFHALGQRSRPRGWSVREIVNAVFYVLRGDISWQLLPT